MPVKHMYKTGFISKKRNNIYKTAEDKKYIDRGFIRYSHNLLRHSKTGGNFFVVDVFANIGMKFLYQYRFSTHLFFPIKCEYFCKSMQDVRFNSVAMIHWVKITIIFRKLMFN